jgi:hypothetical protein
MLFTPDTAHFESWEIRSNRDGAERVRSHVPRDTHETVALLVYAFLDHIEKPATVHEAKLIVPVMGPAGQSGEVSIGTILTGWSRGPLGWSVPWAAPGMKLDADYEPLRSVPVVTPDDGSIVSVAFDVTADLQRWVSGRLVNYGWRITSDLQFGSPRNPIRGAQPTVSVKYIDDGLAVENAGVSAGGI